MSILAMHGSQSTHSRVSTNFPSTQDRVHAQGETWQHPHLGHQGHGTDNMTPSSSMHRGHTYGCLSCCVSLRAVSSMIHSTFPKYPAHFQRVEIMFAEGNDKRHVLNKDQEGYTGPLPWLERSDVPRKKRRKFKFRNTKRSDDPGNYARRD